MVTRSLVVVLACSSYLLVIQILVAKTIALRVTPNNVDEYLIENQRTRTRTRQNYVVQRALGALDNELSANMDNLVVADTFDSEINPEDLSAQIVDYANMIRNDIIFLDNSVETTTRKKGNIKKKNVSEQVQEEERPCNCNTEKDVMDLGFEFYPQKLETLSCRNTKSCTSPFLCKAVYYTVTVMKRVSPHSDEIPLVDFHNRWVGHRVNVTTSCVCDIP